MSTFLESIRSTQESIELLQKSMVDLLQVRPHLHHDIVLNELRIVAYRDEIQRLSKKLIEQYEAASSFSHKVSFLTGENVNNDTQPPKLLELFENSVKMMEETNAKETSISHQPLITSAPDLIAEERSNSFSNAEVYGKFIDLTPFFQEFCNLPYIKDAGFEVLSNSSVSSDDLNFVAKLDIFNYLRKFVSIHSEIPHRVKNTRHYHRYVIGLSEYVLAFYERRSPLTDILGEVVAWENDFYDKLKHNELPGWLASHPTSTLSDSVQLLDLEKFTDSTQLEALGMDVLRDQLAVRGLKTGGGLSDRASRLFSVKGLRAEEYPKKIRATTNTNSAPSGNPPEPVDSNLAVGRSRFAQILKEKDSSVSVAAFAEFVVLRLSIFLREVFEATRRHLERCQTRTYAEVLAEREAELGGLSANMETEDGNGTGMIYSGMGTKMVLGWDGKPIPYWLYRLHGMNVEYTCEICGNVTFQGRRNFDKHFQEWRHSQCMRALGIPNTKHFHDITKIEDAKNLYNTIKQKLEDEAWKPGKKEEFEDSYGNVLDKDTYEMLERQGLL